MTDVAGRPGEGRPGEDRLGAGRWIEAAQPPSTTVTSVHQLTTSDGATVSGVLRTVPGARTVVCIMHPRQDVTHHVLVPELLMRGFAVWTQGTRSVGNDLSLVHEQALLDAAAGQVFLRDRDFAAVVTLGHSGGGTLFAFYGQQAARPAAERIARTPAGRPAGLAETDMPVPDASVFMAPHPGPGALLLRLIDPSVTDERDPLSADPSLDPYHPANGFVPAPGSSRYDPGFVERYRQAQHDRIARIDAEARRRAAEASAARQAFRLSEDPADRRTALAPRVITVYRTDADLRSVDLALDPNDRPYGSLFGRRPDLTNYGLVGFGRFSTPDAWLFDVVRLQHQRGLPAVCAGGDGPGAAGRADRRPGVVPGGHGGDVGRVPRPGRGHRLLRHGRLHQRPGARDALRRPDRQGRTGREQPGRRRDRGLARGALPGGLGHALSSRGATRTPAGACRS